MPWRRGGGYRLRRFLSRRRRQCRGRDIRRQKSVLRGGSGGGAIAEELIAIVREQLGRSVQRVGVAEVEIEARDVVLEKEVPELTDAHVLPDTRIPAVIDQVQVRPTLPSWRYRDPRARAAAHQRAVGARPGGDPCHTQRLRGERRANLQAEVAAEEDSMPFLQRLKAAVLHAVQAPLTREAPAA